MSVDDAPIADRPTTEVTVTVDGELLVEKGGRDYLPRGVGGVPSA